MLKKTNLSTVPIQSRLDELNFRRLVKLAKDRGLSVSMMIRFILVETLKNEKIEE